MTSLRQFSYGVVIPTRNERAAIPAVLGALPPWINRVVVGDFRSTDGTPEAARAGGAVVVAVDRPGYGAACLQAIAKLPDADILIFIDGDAADDLTALEDLVRPIVENKADLVIGSRVLGTREKGALTPQQIFGNWLSCQLIKLIWKVRFTDLGPFRAISRQAYDRLAMADENYGWTVEMQVKAAALGMRCMEIPANYKRRIGHSKVSGTIKGAVKAGVKILYVIAREALHTRKRNSTDES